MTVRLMPASVDVENAIADAARRMMGAELDDEDLFSEGWWRAAAWIAFDSFLPLVYYPAVPSEDLHVFAGDEGAECMLCGNTEDDYRHVAHDHPLLEPDPRTD